jgi:hypothetical protein
MYITTRRKAQWSSITFDFGVPITTAAAKRQTVRGARFRFKAILNVPRQLATGKYDVECDLRRQLRCVLCK